MMIAEALTRLRAWCNRSRGEPIEIAPGITGSFQSRGTYAEPAVREIESESRRCSDGRRPVVTGISTTRGR